jgi:hypothetical protein
LHSTLAPSQEYLQETRYFRITRYELKQIIEQVIQKKNEPMSLLVERGIRTTFTKKMTHNQSQERVDYQLCAHKKIKRSSQINGAEVR